MKSSLIYNIAAGMLLLTGAAACTDNNYTELDKGSTPLSITASQSDLFLNESNHSVEAVSIEWTTGENFGTGNAISYTLELAETATDFSAPVTVLSDSRQVYSWKPTTENLNQLLI
ncbi:MAG: DUF5116 domain-containing protein, partial [Bacteroides sp.]|nr:DUF5116 domain-containing protein [Bacteroides sp.]